MTQSEGFKTFRSGLDLKVLKPSDWVTFAIALAKCDFGNLQIGIDLKVFKTFRLGHQNLQIGVGDIVPSRGQGASDGGFGVIWA